MNDRQKKGLLPAQIEFTVPTVPVAQPRGKPFRLPDGSMRVAVAKGHKVNQFKASVQFCAQQAYQGPVLRGPVRLSVVFVMPRPQSKIWKRKPMPQEWHTKKPDLDNLVKSVKDALSGVLWHDDSQVCSERLEKGVAAGDEQPCVQITVDILDDD